MSTLIIAQIRLDGEKCIKIAVEQGYWNIEVTGRTPNTTPAKQGLVLYISGVSGACKIMCEQGQNRGDA